MDDRVSILFALTVLSGLHYMLGFHKRKDDLFQLRFKFYQKAFALWGQFGFFYQLKWLWIYRGYELEVEIKHQGKARPQPGVKPKDELDQARDMVSDHRAKIEKSFPGYLKDDDDYSPYIFEIIFAEARFLFDANIEKFLRELKPFNTSQHLGDPDRFYTFEDYWGGVPDRFSLQFDKYLNLTENFWEKSLIKKEKE